METITLVVPEVQPQTVNVGYRVSTFSINVDLSFITVGFRGTNGEYREWRNEGPTAATRIKALNTANLTVKSLHRRCIEFATADGVFAGAITGTPDV
jgi:hypothetical protein